MHTGSLQYKESDENMLTGNVADDNIQMTTESSQTETALCYFHGRNAVSGYL